MTRVKEVERSSPTVPRLAIALIATPAACLAPRRHDPIRQNIILRPSQRIIPTRCRSRCRNFSDRVACGHFFGNRVERVTLPPTPAKFRRDLFENLGGLMRVEVFMLALRHIHFAQVIMFRGLQAVPL